MVNISDIMKGTIKSVQGNIRERKRLERKQKVNNALKKAKKDREKRRKMKIKQDRLIESAKKKGLW